MKFNSDGDGRTSPQKVQFSQRRAHFTTENPIPTETAAFYDGEFNSDGNGRILKQMKFNSDRNGRTSRQTVQFSQRRARFTTENPISTETGAP
jgi:hypothetical protein